ncbi:MAG: glycosyltransferase [Cytophagales bacterium]|nr:glycosyltransferase [Cytophagales bacterium]
MLTLAIPTYNRKSFLVDLLNSIEKNVSILNKNLFEVWIVDNDSTDGTGNIENNFTFNLKYIKNDSNIGCNKNINKCYTTPKTPYIWVIGDDEILPIGSIDKILSLIITEKPGLIINKIQGHRTLSDIPEVFPSYQSFAHYADYVNPYLLIYHSYISANIIRNDCYDELFHDKMHHSLYDWFHAITSRLIENKSKICFTSNPNLIVRATRAPSSEHLSQDARNKFHVETCNAQVDYLNWIKNTINLVNINPQDTVSIYEQTCLKYHLNYQLEK